MKIRMLAMPMMLAVVACGGAADEGAPVDDQPIDQPAEMTMPDPNSSVVVMAQLRSALRNAMTTLAGAQAAGAMPDSMTTTDLGLPADFAVTFTPLEGNDYKLLASKPGVASCEVTGSVGTMECNEGE